MATAHFGETKKNTGYEWKKYSILSGVKYDSDKQ
jgi:hypothetical protein